MPVTRLDPNSALIVIDLQKGVAAMPCAHPMSNVVEAAGALAAAFRSKGLPVVLVNATGFAPGRTEQGPRVAAFPPDFAELMPELNAEPGDRRHSKQTWGAFAGGDLDAFLKSQMVTQVVICGVATSIGVESTARQAHELGYHVALAVDAMTDMSADAHANSVARIFPRLGETGTAQEIIALVSAAR